MDREQWARAKEIFAEAISKPPAERDAFIRKLCGSDEALLSEVRTLLESHEDAGDFMATQTQERLEIIDDEKSSFVGSVIKGRYRIERRLGSGGGGVVFLADDLNLQPRKVVLKFLRNESYPGMALKFKHEAEALARLDHPGIVAAFDADELPDGTPFLVMQYVDGVTLRDVLRNGKMSFRRTAAIVRQLGDALHAAHEKRIIHRDLKPENIMLQTGRNGADVVKIVDFGIARVDQPHNQGDTSVFDAAGTPSYMSPEHLVGRPSQASDIYSLAVVIFEMLTGRRPFSSVTPFRLRGEQRGGLPRGALRKRRPKAPVSLEEKLRKALAYQPEHRPSDAQVFCDSIASDLESISGSSTRRKLLLAALVPAIGFGVYNMRRRFPVSSRAGIIVQTGNAENPLEHGFTQQDDITGSALRNAARTGYEGWLMKTSEQGLYVHTLSDVQKQECLEGGWRITLQGRAIRGALFAVADFAPHAPRFDLSVYREPSGKAAVLLCQQHAPLFDGMRYYLPDDGKVAHTFELVYDPAQRTAAMYVDGVRHLEGYRGHTQQQGSHGFFFGVSIFRTPDAESILNLVKFEQL